MIARDCSGLGLLNRFGWLRMDADAFGWAGLANWAARQRQPYQEIGRCGLTLKALMGFRGFLWVLIDFRNEAGA